ncbi:hypothetical protein G7K_0622-t1 [Saitoella complicata NRRL Y-17804]|uniref:Uncharacterized protein n=2 Tax=Saitoella complicata (strain BCRC 22490 / CBS 7301 / JCM 7358 / NBRC 10748 / NRRL Y-17804) TaxID=698492 RepID=A0A0E9N9L6_SAICN|nr:hypothetical protein G7K_0622-t1 [Saitoella complicata NRRL Y-17804]
MMLNMYEWTCLDDFRTDCNDPQPIYSFQIQAPADARALPLLLQRIHSHSGSFITITYTAATTMKTFGIISTIMALAAAVSAQNGPYSNSTGAATTPLAASSPAGAASVQATLSTTTEVVKSYTTYIPSPTLLVEGFQTYTILSATMLTVTDCPCTRTKVLTTSTVTVCPTSCAASSATGAAVAAAATVATGVSASNGTSSSNVTVKATASPAVFTGAAGRTSVGAGMAAVVGLAGAVAMLM